MASPAAVLDILLVANTAQANAALARTQGQLATTGKTAKATGMAMKTAMLGIGVAAAAAGVALYKVGEEFDDAFDKISTRTGATGKELEKLKGSFRNVVSDVPANFDDASSAVADLNARMGLSRKPLEKMAKQITELSRITGTDVEANVESVSKAFVDWEVKTKNMGKTLDGFYRISQESGASVDEMAAAVQKFGSPLRQLGFSLGEAASMWATFVRAGVNTQTMVPGLKLAISNLVDPVDELKTKFKDLGISMGDPEQGLKDVFALLGDQSNLGKVEKITLAMDVFGKRAGADMKEAIEQGRFEIDKMLETFRNGDGTIRQSGRETMDLAEHWQRFTNLLKLQVEPIATDVFKGLGDLMKEVTKTFKKEGMGGVVDLLLQKLNDAMPKIAEAGGEIGLKLLAGIGKAFYESNVLGKLFIGAAALRLFGGAGVFGKIGGSIATRIAAGVKAGGWAAVGRSMGLFMGPAAVLAIGLYKDEIIDALVPKGAIRDALHDAFDPSPGGDTNVLNDLWTETKNQIEAFTGEAEKLEVTLSGIQTRALSATRETLRDQLAAWTASGHKVNEQIIWNWAENQKITAAGASRLIEILHDVSEQSRKAFAKLGEFLGIAGDGVKMFTDLAANRLRGFADMSDNQLAEVRSDLDRLGEAFKRAGDKVADFTKAGADKLRDFAKDADRSLLGNNGISGIVGRMVNATGDGFTILGNNVNKMMSALGIKKKVGFSIETVGDTAKKFQTGGKIVPGSGDGDKVHALLEPGEVVWNKKAVAALGGAQKANSINSMIPRFASGGVIEQALGPITAPPIVADDAHGALGYNSHLHLDFFTKQQALAYGHKMQGMGWTIAEYTGSNPYGFGPVTTHHDAPGHFDGTAFDANTGSDETDSEVQAVAALLGGKGVVSAVAEKLARVILKGPDGPLKSMGQSSLDMVRDAANKYIAAKAPAAVGGGVSSIGPGADINNLPKALEKFNYIWKAGPTIPLDPLREGLGWAGLPVDTFMNIIRGESGYQPGAVGSDAAAGYGNTFGYGLTQITTGYSDADVKAATGGTDYQQMLNPWLNLIAAKHKMDAAGGLSPWAGTAYLQRGGIIPGIIQKFASGTGDGKGDKGKSPLEKLLKKIKNATTSIGSIDEQISIAEGWAGLESSPGGSDLDPTEQSNLVTLNQGLLGKLQGERNLIKDALLLTGHKEGRLDKRLGSIDSREIKRRSEIVKDLRKKLKGGDDLAKLREELRNAKTPKEKAKIQKEIDQATKAGEAETSKIEQQIQKQQKLISKLKAERTHKREKLHGKLDKAEERSASLKALLEEVQGVTGKGGRIFDTQLTLAGFGSATSSGATAMDISGLRSVIEAARYGVFDNLPKFHSGGMVPGSPSQEVPIMARGGEVVSSGGVNVTNNFSFDEFGMLVETYVDDRLAKRERIAHKKARQYSP